MSKQTHQTMDAAPVMPAFWVATVNGSALDALRRATDACSKACFAWQQELTRFTVARLKSDSELGQKLLSSQNWSDAIKLQQDWMAAAGQDYFDEARNLMQLAQEVSSCCAVTSSGTQSNDQPQSLQKRPSE